MAGFMGTPHYCIQCMVGYPSKSRHKCPGDSSCNRCHRPLEEHQDPLPVALTCESCFRVFSDRDCFALHKSLICKRSWCCPKCQFSYPHRHPKEKHQCYESKCATCGEYAVKSQHRCFIQPEKAKPAIASGKIRVFDFESDISGGHHVPNFAVVSDEEEKLTCYENHGDSIMTEFMNQEILNPKYRGTTFIAHNAKGYDAQFVREELDKRKVKYSRIDSGRKILLLEIGHLHIRIIDSLSFIPQALAKFPKMFGLKNMAKGTYPYRFNTKANWSYVGPVPSLHWFLPDGCGVTAEQLQRWKRDNRQDPEDDEYKLMAKLYAVYEYWQARVDKNEVYHHYEELKRYCIADVLLLLRGLQKFRQEFQTQTENAWPLPEPKQPKQPVTTAPPYAMTSSLNPASTETVGVDPFAYVTISQACMATYHHRYLAKNTIAYFPHTVDVHSLLSIQWLEFLSRDNAPPILHARNTPDRSEIRVCGHRVDGYCTETKTVFEFNGCYWHACPQCFPPKSSRYTKQLRKEAFLRSQGYTVVTIWECAFRKLQHTTEFKAFLEKYPQLQEKLPLNVRDAFYGGRTNAACLYYKFAVDEIGCYDDFTSLYPSVNSQGVYPVGHPTILLTPSVEKLRNGEYFGVAKAKILPPRGLYHPILPEKGTGKLVFSLCHTCAVTTSSQCTHSFRERALTGTWCTPEIDLAVEYGYTILEVYEVHHFEERTEEGNGVMKEYVKEFLRGKQEASGWPEEDMSEEEKQAYIRDYHQHEGILLNRANIVKNPGRRQCCKLMVTSLWGKTGQRGNMPRTVVVYNTHEFNAIVFSEEYEVGIVDRLPHHEYAWQITYKLKSEFIAKEPRNTNVYIAAFTTTWARIKLWKKLHELGKRVLYYDTDSIIYKTGPGESPLPRGPYLGDLTNELEEGRSITEFVSTGPKSYAYRDNKGAQVIKFKGISKTLYNVSKINLETMVKCVSDASFRVSELDGPRNMRFHIDKFGRLKT